MTVNIFLSYLKKHHQRIDSVIAEDIGLDIETIRKIILDLESKHVIQTCNISYYNKNGEVQKGILCRIAGYIPTSSPGRREPWILK
jgi:hypothetical protein